MRVVKLIAELLFDGMKEALEKGERIEVRGFGSLIVRNYGGYNGRNPKTGEIVHVPPKPLIINKSFSFHSKNSSSL